MRTLRLIPILAALVAGCYSEPLDPGTGGTNNGVDMSGADLAGGPCEAARGYCAPGDLVQPMCRTGFREGTAVEQAHPGVCGLGICCVPVCKSWGDQPSCQQAGCQWNECSPNSECTGAPGCQDPDCRMLGCPDPSTTCGPCWTSWICLPAGAVC